MGEGVVEPGEVVAVERPGHWGRSAGILFRCVMDGAEMLAVAASGVSGRSSVLPSFSCVARR